MLTLNVITTVDDEKFINGSVNGTKFNVSYSDDLFKSLQDLKTQINNATSSEDYYTAIESAKSLINATLDGEGDLITQANKDLILDSKTGKYYVSIEDEVSITPVPQRLVSVILESVEKGIDSTPIVKAWIRFLRNPNFTERKAELFAEYVTAVIIDQDMVQKLIDEEGFSESQAVKRSLYNDVSITEEGLIVAKKYARLLNEGYEMDKETNKVKKVPMYGKTEDKVDRVTGEVTEGEFLKPEFAEEMYFEPPVQGTRGDAFSSGETKGHIIRVGEIHALDNWNQVNTDDNQSCVKGLHVGGWQYVQSYQGLNCQLLECFVDPADIGAICDMRSGDGAIRVKSYMVYGATEGRNKGIYHSSKYAAMKDAEWDAYKAEAVKAANEKVAALGR